MMYWFIVDTSFYMKYIDNDKKKHILISPP
jgi:hypothetical protein